MYFVYFVDLIYFVKIGSTFTNIFTNTSCLAIWSNRLASALAASDGALALARRFVLHCGGTRTTSVFVKVFVKVVFVKVKVLVEVFAVVFGYLFLHVSNGVNGLMTPCV